MRCADGEMEVDGKVVWRQGDIAGALQDRVLLCCDLRDTLFRGARLERLVFFGCDLTGALFRDATLKDCTFIGCFSLPGGHVVDLAGATLTGSVENESSVTAAGAPEALFKTRWPPSVDSCAMELRSLRNDIRYFAASRAGADITIGRIVYPLLGCLLNDEEWDVRSAALRSLASIRQTLGVFPHYDAELVERMLTLLGDENSFVRATAAELLPVMGPSDDLLRRIVSRTTQTPLTAMLAAQTLLRLNASHRRLIDPGAVEGVAGGGSPEARVVALEVLRNLAGC